MPVQPVLNALGGSRTWSQRSGILASQDNVIFSGQGRLNQVVPHGASTLSSIPIILYDAVSFSSGAGTNPVIIGVVPSLPLQIGTVNQSGGSNYLGAQVFNMPFLSGLCVSAPSGSPGFTVSFTPNDPTIRS